MKRIAALSVITLFSLPGLAAAQTKAPVMHAAGSDAMTVSEQGRDDVLASKLVGATVYSPSDEKVGDIQYMVINKAGRVEAIVVGVGGFLGIDKKDVALTFNSPNVTYDADNSVRKITTNVTKDALKAAPAYVFLKRS
jgi:hypothetical protein